MSYSNNSVADKVPMSYGRLLLLFLTGVLIAVANCYDGLVWMVNAWFSSAEYSYGILIPFIAAFLVWQRKEELRQLRFEGSASGAWLVIGGLVLNLLGKLAAVFTLQQYAFVCMLVGIAALLAGWHITRRLTVPLLMLVFMIPLPNFLLNNLSAYLQLVSSKLGVLVIRSFGISVFVEGNVIDLGAMQLQVAEACSGLRYLFPLMVLGFIMSYFFKVEMWKRVLVFFSSIPVTIFMNSLRIGLIGVTVEYWGRAAAEGFLHDFEGWVVFMASTAVLLLEMVILNRLGKHTRPWQEVFGVEFPPPAPAASRWQLYVPSKGVFITLGAMLACVVLVWNLGSRHQQAPSHASVAEFPVQIDNWSGRRSSIEGVYLDTLKLDDYLMADYTDGAHAANLYVAWYDTQQAGRSTHSPRTCIPGGGWRISSLTQKDLSQIKVAGDVPLRVNRAIIENGNQKQLVYYWFQQRGRVITNEYAAKWFLFWDSLTRNRTDGALVRLIMPLPAGTTVEDVEPRLVAFTSSVVAKLDAYVPR